ncbi:trigger factor [Myxococcota bacterium]|jgi:trigger factor|nr:trigger factor [Myxococcota bacterium]
MQVRIEEQSSTAKRVTIVVPAKDVAREFSGAYGRLGQRVNLPGFRRGKVPTDVLKKRYGQQVSIDVAQNLIESGWRHALKEHNLLPVNQPKIDGQLDPARPDAEFTFSFTVETPPSIDLLPYETIALEKTDWQITQDHVDHELTHVAESAAEWHPIADRDVAQKGDMAVVDFEGALDGVPFEGGKAEEYEIVLGSGRLIPGFEDQIIGQKKDAAFEVNVDFPEEYPNKELAGRKATFATTLKDLKVKVTPAIDDGLAGTLGLENLEKLKEVVRERMGAQWEQAAKNEAYGRIQAHIAETYRFELPASMVEAELDARKKSAEAGDAEDGAEATLKSVEDSLRISFVLDAVAEKESVEVSEAELNREIEMMVRSAGAYGARVRQMYRENDRRASLRRRIRHMKVLDFLLTKANVTLVQKEIPAHDHGEHSHDAQG